MPPRQNHNSLSYIQRKRFALQRSSNNLRAQLYSIHSDCVNLQSKYGPNVTASPSKLLATMQTFLLARIDLLDFYTESLLTIGQMPSSNARQRAATFDTCAVVLQAVHDRYAPSIGVYHALLRPLCDMLLMEVACVHDLLHAQIAIAHMAVLDALFHLNSARRHMHKWMHGAHHDGGHTGESATMVSWLPFGMCEMWEAC